MPFGLGGRYWFKGPQKTIRDEDLAFAVVEGEEQDADHSITNIGGVEMDDKRRMGRKLGSES